MQNTLQQLIAGLSPNEKRYFRMFSNVQPGDKRYLQLFDSIEKSGDYNVKALTAELGFTADQLVDHKRYLNQALFKSLRTMDEPPWKVPQFYKDVIDCINLLERGMPEAALALVEKKLQENRHFEKFAVTLALLNAKHRILVALRRIEDIRELAAEMRSVMAAYDEYLDQFMICIECQQFTMEFKDQEKTRHLLKNPLLKKDPAKMLSVSAASCWFNTYMQAYNILGETKKLNLITQRMVAFYKSHPSFMDIDARSYIMAHLSLSQSELFDGNYTKSLALLDDLKPLIRKPPKYLNPGHLPMIDFYVKHTRSFNLRMLGNYREAVSLGHEMYKNKEICTPYECYGFIYEFGIALLLTQNSKEAYEKLDEVLQMGDGYRADIQIYVRPLIMLAQIDMGNFSLVPYLIKSTKAWMKRKKIKNTELDIFFHHMYAIAKAPALQRAEEWQRLVKTINNGGLKEFNKHMNSLKTWITAKKRA